MKHESGILSFSHGSGRRVPERGSIRILLDHVPGMWARVPRKSASASVCFPRHVSLHVSLLPKQNIRLKVVQPALAVRSSL